MTTDQKMRMGLYWVGWLAILAILAVTHVTLGYAILIWLLYAFVTAIPLRWYPFPFQYKVGGQYDPRR